MADKNKIVPLKDKNKSAPYSNNRAGKQLNEQEIYVGEELKIAVNVAINRFTSNESQLELEFPSSLTSNERAYVHRYCKDRNLATKSRGKGNKRYVIVSKVKAKSVSVSGVLAITRQSSNSINSLLQDLPVTSRDKHELSGQRLHRGIVNEQNKILAQENRLVLGNAPHIPPDFKETELKKKAMNLPIHEFKDSILETISKNSVTMIAGDTGSGKSTQVAQFLLEKSYKGRTPCRIICTQPRRLSAISIAERVSAERGERIGQTVGYQVRLESKMSSKTLLNYCTTGVLLRLLMVGHKCLSNLTHIIVDEIHERDSFSDYLLISLRDILKSYKKLKIILMSASLNADLFTNYFGNCPLIHVNGSSHDVQTFFLEDILKQTGYVNKGMRKMAQGDNRILPKNEESSSAAKDVLKLLKEDKITSEDKAESYLEVEGEEDKKKSVDEDCDSGEKIVTGNKEESQHNDNSTPNNEDEDDDKEEDDEVNNLAEDLDDDLEIEIESEEENSHEVSDGEDQSEERNQASMEMDAALAQAWLSGDDEAFDQIIHLIMNENVHIDYQHSDTKMTSLIVAAARGNLTLAEQLIELGAKLDLRDPNNNRNAYDWANHFNQNHVVDYIKGVNQSISNDSSGTLDNTSIDEDLTEKEKQLLELYHKSFDDQRVDISLILSLLGHVCHAENLKGSILIFLPGYDEIVTLRDKLKQDKEFSKRNKYQILMLHSMLPPGNQRKVFGHPPPGMQKIILSTNIAETGITIDDVVCVIDSGKVKEKSHDAISCVSTLRTVWISKASAVQRRGRAGRCMPGVCYHLFSQERFHHFQTYQDAEILRVPIHTLCLQTKMLAPANVSITDYLAKAPEPPNSLIIRNSIKLLKDINALDESEEMTDLGKLLVELPIDPQFGKMVLIGMTLKCLEPSIVIACCSAYKEPFLLPNVASQKSAASSAKLKLSSTSHCDQIAMLRAFQGWQRAKRDGKEKVHCIKNFISVGTMEMVSGMRRQVVSLLRNLGLIRTKGPGSMRDLNQNSRNWSVIKAVVGAGLYPNFIKVDKEKMMLLSEKERKVTIHNTSVLVARSEDKVHSTVSRAKKLNSTISSIPLDWLAYEELSRLYYSVQIRSVAVLSSVAVALVGGSCLSYNHSCLRLRSSRQRKGRGDRPQEGFFQESDSEDEEKSEEANSSFKIDEWISFTGKESTLYSLAMLRIKFLALFSKHIQIPAKAWSQADSDIVQTIAEVLLREEQSAGDPSLNPAGKDFDMYDHRKFNRQDNRYENRYDNRQDNRYDNRFDRSRGRGMRQYNRRDYQNQQQQHSDNRQRYHNNKRGGGGGGVSLHNNNRDHNDQVESPEGGSVADEKRRERSFFILKCNNEKNMAISFNRNIWATTKSNEKRLARAFNDSEEVLLVFSVQGSGRFQGVAKMASAISDEYCEDFGSANLGGVFDIEWIHQKDIPFQGTQHLMNPWNDNKKVQISRDAQEVEPRVGQALVDLWSVNAAANDGDCTSSREETSSPNEQLRHLNNAIEGEQTELKQQQQQQMQVDDQQQQQQQQQQEFYPQHMYTNASGENEPQYVEEYPLYSPPPFSPQFMPADYQQVEIPAHYAPAPPHMGYNQQPPYPTTAMYGPAPPGQGNMAPATYSQQEYYSFQYSPPRQGVDVYQRAGSSNEKKMYPS